ncbi:hypothetical protein NDU88_001113 [Pleurodeles waltl]|uniref:Uncharacterized protein n=1 Tax=Pleurodeles waltl TaxID=8319 RepID=A0AAV7S7P9_PLEWA|nr:hypothetical protein NDU88_001113 [Pleurodeles waltl]
MEAPPHAFAAQRCQPLPATLAGMRAFLSWHLSGHSIRCTVWFRADGLLRLYPVVRLRIVGRQLLPSGCEPAATHTPVTEQHHHVE